MLESVERLRDWAKRPDGSFWQTEISDFSDAIERENSERYVPLPTDADGVLWKYNDHNFVDERGRKLTLTGMRINIVGEWDLHSYTSWHKASLCRHVKPRIVEDVLFEFGNECADNCGADPDDVVKYAKELRELLNGDTDD